MAIKLFLTWFLSLGIFFGGYSFTVAESESEAGQESEGEAGSGSGEEAAAGGAGAGDGAAASDAAAGTVVPAEIQQQLDGVQKTIDTVQSVKEKGLLQTIWDNVSAPFVAIFKQIGQMISQVLSIFGAG